MFSAEFLSPYTWRCMVPTRRHGGGPPQECNLLLVPRLSRPQCPNAFPSTILIPSRGFRIKFQALTRYKWIHVDYWCVPFFHPNPSSPLLFLAIKFIVSSSPQKYMSLISTGQQFQRWLLFCWCWSMFLSLLVQCELLDVPILPPWVGEVCSEAIVISFGGCALVAGIY